MVKKVSQRGSWFTIALVIAAVALWALEQKQQAGGTSTRRPVPEKDGVRPAEKPRPPSTPAAAPRSSPAPRGSARKEGRYEVYEGCTLAPARNNDGDSFRVTLADGREEEFRLYFVDTPESAFKRYAGGETNHPRIRQQAADLGGVTPEQAVAIGKKAKDYTLALLGSKPFTLFTEWDSPYRDGRYHAHVRVEAGGRPRWLHQLLIEKGYARILTKPGDLPDGTPAAREKSHLRDLERVAKEARVGVWAL